MLNNLAAQLLNIILYFHTKNWNQQVYGPLYFLYENWNPRIYDPRKLLFVDKPQNLNDFTVFFYSIHSINSVLNLHTHLISSIYYNEDECRFNTEFIEKMIFQRHAYNLMLMYSALLMLCLYSTNAVIPV